MSSDFHLPNWCFGLYFCWTGQRACTLLFDNEGFYNFCIKVHKSVMICQFSPYSRTLSFIRGGLSIFKKCNSVPFYRCSSSSESCFDIWTFFDFQHTTAINQISIDQSGDYVASCSDDGRVSTLKSCVLSTNLQGNCSTWYIMWYFG